MRASRIVCARGQRTGADAPRARSGSAASVVQASGFRTDVTVFRLNAASRPNLAWNLHLGGIRRNAYTHARRLITRRSQVQILPPLFGKALATGPFLCSWWLERDTEDESSAPTHRTVRRRGRAGSQGALRVRRPGRRRAGLHLTERSAGGSVERRQRPRQQLTDAIVAHDGRVAQTLDERASDACAHRCDQVQPVRGQARAQDRHLDDRASPAPQRSDALDHLAIGEDFRAAESRSHRSCRRGRRLRRDRR